MSTSLAQRDKAVIWHPYTPQKHSPDPIPIVKGDGVYLIDANGTAYIDAISSWWVTIHGHAHPYIAQKIYEQATTLEQVIFAGFTHEPAVQLAERLLKILPGDFSKIFYSDNGSTTVEVAVKMGLQYWWNQGITKRNKVLALTHSYHGDTFGAMSISERSVFTLAFQDKLFEVIFIDPPTSHSPLVTSLPWDEIACFIYEPLLQGAGGMVMYEAAALNNLLQQCHAHGVICIADEVMTGFGRTGKFFASMYVEEQPDIICLSKGLTGGTMALGITACTANIHSAFVHEDRQKTFFHGHSFTANPLACSAALASLDLLLQPSCLDQIENITQLNKQFVQKLQTGVFKQQIKNLRSLGTIAAFEIEQGNDSYLNNVKELVTQKALDQGVYLRPLGNTVYIMPPYCITDSALEKVYGVIINILQSL